VQENGQPGSNESIAAAEPADSERIEHLKFDARDHLGNALNSA
jgi:hypothetical protein